MEVVTILEIFKLSHNLTESDARNLLILRLLATPISTTLWRIHKNAESWVLGITDHFTDRYFSKPSKKYLWFQVPQSLACELLPDHYLRLTLPEPIRPRSKPEIRPSVSSDDRILKRSGSNNDQNSSETRILDDPKLIKISLYEDPLIKNSLPAGIPLPWPAKIEPKATIKYNLFDNDDPHDTPDDNLLLWNDEPSISESQFNREYLGTWDEGTTNDKNENPWLRPRLSQRAINCIMSYPDITKRILFFCKDIHNPLDLAEIRVFNTLKLDITLIRRET